MCHSKDSLISRTTKFRQFQLAIFVSFVTISFALCQGWPCCLSEFYLNRTSNFKVTFQTFTSYENYCVWPQHLFSKRTNHKLRKKLPNQKCHKDNYMEFEHNTVHKFADTLYRWFRVSAMQVMFFIIRRSKKLVTNA